MIIQDASALRQQIAIDMAEVINQITTVMVDIVVQNVWDVVYEPYRPKEYQRQEYSGGFIGSWTRTTPYFNGRNLQAVVFSYDAGQEEYGRWVAGGFNEMTLDGSNYIHGSGGEEIEPKEDIFVAVLDQEEEEDRRSIMDRAIAEGTDYDFPPTPNGDWWTHPRDYWRPSLEQIESEQIISEITEDILRYEGIKFRRIN